MLSARANLSQALWLAAVAATGLALFAAARSRTRIAAVVPVLLGAAIAVPAMPRQLADAWVADRRATELVCTSDQPQVCIPRVYSHALDQLRGPARQALAVLAAKLPPAPTRVVVETDGNRTQGPPPADTLLMRVSPFATMPTPRRARLDMDARRRRRPAVCEPARLRPDQAGVRRAAPGAGRPVPGRAQCRRGLAPRPGPATGAGQGGKESEETLAPQALAALRRLPADEQRARVTALRDAELTCADGDRLDLLTGPSGPR